MSPNYATPNISDGRIMDAVGRRDLARFSGVRANLADYLWCQLGHAIASAAKNYIAPLAHSIGGIVGICSEKKMVRINARRHVAFVQNIEPRRDGAAMAHPRKPVGELWAAGAPEGPVRTTRRTASQPEPTSTVWFRNGPIVEFLRKRETASRTPIGSHSCIVHAFPAPRNQFLRALSIAKETA